MVNHSFTATIYFEAGLQFIDFILIGISFLGGRSFYLLTIVGFREIPKNLDISVLKLWIFIFFPNFSIF
jgi:hypothetical protein